MSKLTMQVIGHLGNDAVLKEVGGQKLLEFSVAHSEKFTNRDGVKTEKTTWVKCAWWTDRINIAQYLKKGGLVEVSGQPRATAYLNQQNTPAASLEMNVFSLTLLGGSPQSSPQPQPTQAPQEQQIPSQPKEVDLDLPF